MKTIKVLAIGNSFSQDATRYLHDIAQADGVRMEVMNLYIGGCSLERHYRNMLSGQRVYTLQYDGHDTGMLVSLDEALLSRPWDVVTLQQASHCSFHQDSYSPYAQALAEHVRCCQPKAKLLIHQTWAYEADSVRLTQTAGYDTPEKMLGDIVIAYDRAREAVAADGLIPSGQLFAKLLEQGIPQVHRDTFHASRGLGRYALGLLWYRMLTGRGVVGNTFCAFDEPVTPEEQKIAKTCADAFAPALTLAEDQ